MSINVGEQIKKRTGFGGKTLWDLMELLIVPFAIAIIGLSFTALQGNQQQLIESPRAQDATLQGYLDQMSLLLTNEKNLPELQSESNLRVVAWARTLTVLEILDDLDEDRRDREASVLRFLYEDVNSINHKASVVQFLYEGHLIDREGSVRDTADSREDPVVNLSDANLFKFNSSLQSTDLSYADLSGVNLVSTEVLPTLNGADLSNAKLTLSSLEAAQLESAKLSGANISDSSMQSATLNNANLTFAILSDTDLSNAFLIGADLSNAILRNTNLTDANLTDANLTDADLSRAYKYTEVQGSTAVAEQRITNAELEQQAGSLEGATMPDGQKYEDWLKSKGNAENGE